MWSGESFMRGPGHLGSKSAPCSPVKPFQKRAPAQTDSFHVIHKVPLGDSPYVKAKHVQLVDKDPDAAIALFWAAINASDRVDSALKDMAIVMKQQNRPEEAIEAIKSLRYRCSDAAQESLDNVLLDLYKRCGRLDDQIALLKHKLHLIHQGMAFNGKRTKTARSQGKKFQVSIEQEATRLLGNLGWAYMQQSNFLAAEAVYRKALSIGPDNNKVCNLGICLMKQGRMEEAKIMLQSVVPACPDTRWGSDSHLKSYERAQEMLVELESSMGRSSSEPLHNLLQSSLWQPQAALSHHCLRSADTKADSSEDCAVPFSGALSATAGFGPTAPTRPHKKVASAIAHQRSHSQNLGGNQFMAFQSSNSSSAWEDHEPGYTSPDENVDTNVQGVGTNQVPFHFQQWPGESLRQKQEFFSSAMWGPNSEHQRLDTRKLERSLPFGGGAPQRDSEGPNNIGFGSFPFPQIHRKTVHPCASGENFPGKVSSSYPSKSGLGEQAQPTYDQANSMRIFEASPEENEASKQITSGWGNKLTARPPLKSPLGNSELSFFSRWGYNETRPAVRRSLSLESFDTQLEQIALEIDDHEVDKLPSPMQAFGPVKRSRNQTPVKEKSSMWNALGFITVSPEEGLGQHDTHNCNDNDEKINYHRNMSSVPSHASSEAGAAAPSEDPHCGILTERQHHNPGASSVPPFFAAATTASTDLAGETEMIKRQRRLRVFQEITLFPGSPGSPQQVGV